MSSTTMFFLMALVFLGGLGVFYLSTTRSAYETTAPAPYPSTTPDQGPADSPYTRRSFETRQPGVLGPVRQMFRTLVNQLETAGVPREMARLGVIVAVLAVGYILALIIVKLLASIFSGTATIIGQLIKIALVPLWQLVLAAVSLGDSYEWFEGRFGQNAAIAFVGLSLIMMFFLARASTAASRS